MTTESERPLGLGLSKGLGPLPARWYVIDRDGLATPCKDADDAQDVAAAAWVRWPTRGPYRVALLGDVAAEREQCSADAARMQWLATDRNYVSAEEYFYPQDCAKLRAFIDWCMAGNAPADFQA